MWKFADQPSVEDFHSLADYLVVGDQRELHPALWLRREMVAKKLRVAAEKSEATRDPALYHTLRLFCW